MQDNFSELKEKINTVSLDLDELDSDVGIRTQLTVERNENLVNAINELDSDINGPGGGTPASDMDVVATNIVAAINEIERVFDASAGEIIYPTGAPYETQTRLLIDTTAGDDVQVNVGNDFNVNAVGQIVLDADDGANGVFIQDNAVTQFQFLNSGGNKEIDVPSGNLTLDVASNIILDAGGGSVSFLDDGTTAYTFASTGTISRTGNVTLDVSGDITLSADTDNLVFNNGAGGHTVTHNLSNVNGKYTITLSGTGSSDYEIDVPGDIIFDADGNDIIFQNGAGADTVTHNLADTGAYTVTYPSSVTHTISGTTGDLTFNVGGDDVIFTDGTYERIRLNLDSATNITFTGLAASLTNTAGDFTINAATSFVLTTNSAGSSWDFDTNTITHTGDAILDVTGGIVLDTNTGSLSYRDAGTNAIVYSLDPAGTNTATVTGNYQVDASGSITLDADGGDDIIFEGSGVERLRFNVDAVTIIDHTGTSLEIQNQGDLTLDPVGDINMDVGGEQVRLRNGSAANRFTFNLDATPQLDIAGNYTQSVTGTSAYTSTSTQTLSGTEVNITASTEDITLDANGADITLKDNATTYGSLTNVTGQLSIRSGSTPTEAILFNNANITVKGSITLPSSGTGSITATEISATTVHGAIDEVNARIPNIYNASGTLLNP
jgi:hypothetical protein